MPSTNDTKRPMACRGCLCVGKLGLHQCVVRRSGKPHVLSSLVERERITCGYLRRAKNCEIHEKAIAMRQLRQLRYIICAAVCLITALTAPAVAQTFPGRTVRIVVPYVPGGGVSVLGQLLATKMQEIWGQPVIVDNRPGAGGNIGADFVAKSAPDGYTILLHTSALSSASSLYSKLPFDPVKDFVPV